MKYNDELTSYLLQIGEEVLRFLKGKGATKEDAEDIVQNTFYKIYSMLDVLDDTTIRPWFFRVALNEYIDLKRKKFQSNVTLTEQLQMKLAAKDNFEQFFNQHEIFYLLKNVKKEYKEIFMLKYYYDFSYEEIAKLLGLQVENVKQKLYRARKTIRTEAKGLQKWINPFRKH